MKSLIRRYRLWKLGKLQAELAAARRDFENGLDAYLDSEVRSCSTLEALIFDLEAKLVVRLTEKDHDFDHVGRQPRGE
jgi:hypothetical protein